MIPAIRDLNVCPPSWRFQYLPAENRPLFVAAIHLQVALGVQGALRAGHKKTRLPGSSTALVLQLDPTTSKIQAANLVWCRLWLPMCKDAAFSTGSHSFQPGHLGVETEIWRDMLLRAECHHEAVLGVAAGS